MINIMVASSHDPQSLLDVMSCTLAMTEGGAKDACYLVSQHIPVVEILSIITISLTFMPSME